MSEIEFHAKKISKQNAMKSMYMCFQYDANKENKNNFGNYNFNEH